MGNVNGRVRVKASYCGHHRKGAWDHFAMISGVTTILVFRMHSIFRFVTFVIFCCVCIYAATAISELMT
jgi:hypothetical protein